MEEPSLKLSLEGRRNMIWKREGWEVFQGALPMHEAKDRCSDLNMFEILQNACHTCDKKCLILLTCLISQVVSIGTHALL